MKKYITIAALLVAGTAFANAAVVVTFDNNADFGATYTQAISGIAGTNNSYTWSLENEDAVSFRKSSGAYFYNYASAGTWTNTEALEEMNADLGTAITLNLVNGLKATASGAGASTNTFTLDINSIASGTEIVLYTFATAGGNDSAKLTNLTISGLDDAKFSYAVDNGTGFTNTSAFSNTHKAWTLVKVEGTLTDSDITITSTSLKNGIGMLAYSAIPEPSAFGLLAGIGALALVASRRRRK